MRWFEVFASILGEKGITVNFDEDWDGSDETIMVGNETLWEYIENMPESKHDLLKDCLILVTQHFENRVKGS